MRSALFGVTVKTGLIGVCEFQEVLAHRAMWAVAAAATHFALTQRMAGGLVDICAQGLVAGQAHFSLRNCLQSRVLTHMHLVTVRAGRVVFLMGTAGPVEAGGRLVASQAHLVVLVDTRRRSGTEIWDCGPHLVTANPAGMGITGAVAGLALETGEGCAAVGGPTMRRAKNLQYRKLRSFVMTPDAGIGASARVSWCHLGLISRNCQRSACGSCQPEYPCQSSTGQTLQPFSWFFLNHPITTLVSAAV